MPVGFKAVYNGRETEIDDLLIKREFFSDGGLYTWGYGDTVGMLGDGTTTSRSSPGSTAGGLGLNWKQVSGGGTASNHMAAIKTDGTLWTWGYGTSGALGDGTTTARSSPVTTAGGGTNWKQVSVGDGFMGAVKTDGTLWTWGDNTAGQLGTNNTTSRSSPGTTVGGGTNWNLVAVGIKVSAAVKTDGTLWTWGQNLDGQLGTGNTTARSSPGTTAGGGTNWKQASCSYAHVAAVKTDGTLWTWGYNNSGQLGTGNTTARSSPGTTAGGGTNWKQVALAQGNLNWRGVAIKTDGTLWTWGTNGFGGLGDGTTTNRSSPGTTAGGGTNWKQVDSAYDMTVAVKTDGTLWTWGRGTSGQLGDGTVTSRSSPGTIAGGGTNWKQVACVYRTGAAITDLTI